MNGEMGFDEFRDTVLNLIGRDDIDGLRRLCEEQAVMPPLFVEKAIGEIGPGNRMNDLLFLIARRLIEASPDLGGFLGELEAKRGDVPNPDAGGEIIGVTAPTDMRVPEQILRLVRTEIEGIDLEDPSTIETMFADIVVFGPGFCTEYLEGVDLDQYSDRAVFRLPLGDPPEMVEFHARALRGKQRILPLAHPVFEQVLAKYVGANVRRATQEERDLLYVIVDFEIDDESLFVLEGEDGRLAVYTQPGDRIRLVEYLDLWRRGS